jgi:S1-C subfamily serine protease
MSSSQHRCAANLVNIVPLVAVGIFTAQVLWQMLAPDLSQIAKTITVRIDGANTGSGVIIDRRGNRYTVLSNWHVVNLLKSVKVRTSDGRQHLVATRTIKRIAKLDLATVEFYSQSRYPIPNFGNSDKTTEGERIYVSGWADPTAEIRDRSYQFLVGHLSGRIARPQDGYALIYSVNALPGMSGGPVLDRAGNLIGINGRATVDLRTGTVNSVLGIDINRYLRAKP